MGAGPTISQQKLYAAARGNPDMLEILQQMAHVSSQQQAATGTTPVASMLSGSPNPSAPIPPQATGDVSILGAAYIVQIVNPYATNPVSAVQAAQSQGNFNPLTPVQPVRSIYHQIRVSTSPAFNVNSNTQTFGGNTGAAQVYWTLTGLGSGTWYFQFRSTYDGVNFNQWKNANSGVGVGAGIINQVTTETVGDAAWALFTLPGGLVTGIGAALVPDQGIFGLAQQVYSSGMIAISGPDGFTAQNNGVSGFSLCDVDLQIGTGPIVGIADYPVIIRNQMVQASTSNVLSGNASVFAIAFDPSNSNVTLYEQGGTAGAVWATMKLPGGATIALGQGKTVDGGAIWTPPLSWINASRMMSICSLTDAPVSSRPPMTGVGICQLSGLTAEGAMLTDTGALDNRGLQTVNWMAIAWEVGTDVQTIGGFPWLKINLQGGHAMFIGAGQAAAGTAITLPAGCTAANSLSIGTPASSDNSGHHMRGVQQCGLFGNILTLFYTDNNFVWSGNVNFMMATWL